MRALAKYIMRGRAQAALVAVAGNLLPLISPATIGLVTLRRGLADGCLVLLWALLPILAIYLYSDTPSPLAVISIAAMAMLVPVALVLKYCGSWQLSLVVAVVVSILTAAGLLLSFTDQITNIQSNLTTMMGNLAMKENGAKSASEPTTIVDVGFVAYVLALNAAISLVLSRWWQSELYNPGGFGKEFCDLRLDMPIAVLLLGAAIYCLTMPSDYIIWVALLGLPLLFGGIGLVHYAVSTLSVGRHWLVMFYGLLVLAGPIMWVLVVLVGFFDSLINIRPRLAAIKPGR